MVGENFDAASDGSELPSGHSRPNPRSFVGIHFACCEVYTRVYVNRDKTAYEGNCPRCSKPILIKIGLDGTDSRFFRAK